MENIIWTAICKNSRLAEDVASAYQQLKQALLKRYNLTENSYRMKFRLRKPESGESPEYYLFRSQSYLEWWIELSKSEQTYEGLGHLIIKEQFVDTSKKSLDVYLQERAPIDLDQLAKLADQYLLAHGSARMARIKQMWSHRTSPVRSMIKRGMDKASILFPPTHDIGRETAGTTRTT